MLLIYDFGDGWLHEIVFEKILEPEPNAAYPRGEMNKELELRD